MSASSLTMQLDNPEFRWPIFLFGCIGAMAPEIVRLYNLRHNQSRRWSRFYFFVSLLFMFLGGVLAWILPTTTYWGAFYVGVSTPLIVSTIVRDRKPRTGSMGLMAPAVDIEEINQRLKDRKSPPSPLKLVLRRASKVIADLRRNFLNAI